MTFRMPDAFYEPPDPCCDLDECDGTVCADDAADAHEAAMERRAEERADAEREERHG